MSGRRFQRRRWASLLALLGAFSLPAAAGPQVTLIGDGARLAVMHAAAATEQQQIRRSASIQTLDAVNAGVSLKTSAPGAGAADTADLLYATDIGLMVMDGTVGPTPALREQIIIARQARVPMLALLVTRVQRLHEKLPEESAGLLAEEIQTVRDLLSIYELDDGALRIYFDAPIAAPADGIGAFGVIDTLRALAKFAPRRVSGNSSHISAMWSAVYLLSEQESAGQAVSLAPGDRVVVWSEGTRATAKLDTSSEYSPGDFREMRLLLDSPLNGVPGSRILLIAGERVVGLGAVTEVLH